LSGKPPERSTTNEADTCRKLVRPRLEAAGWDTPPRSYTEQTPFTDGRIIVPAGKPRRLKKKFSDFLLRYTRDITLAVVEAKSDKRPAGDGLQQAKDYASILRLKFAYANRCDRTNTGMWTWRISTSAGPSLTCAAFWTAVAGPSSTGKSEER
jgi:type I site-specific restriction endonuclease